MASKIIVTFEAVNYRKPFAYIVLLCILCSVPGVFFASEAQDSLVMGRMFTYKKNFLQKVPDSTQNVYLRYSFRTLKRNPTLFLVPTMYTIAKGAREYIGETYGKITFHGIDNYDIKSQVSTGNISSYRKIMPKMLGYLTPNIYEVSLFRKNILSPFNYSNRHFYKYSITLLDADKASLTFRPRITNTQLITGYAIIDRHNGRVIRTRFHGDFDMVEFEVNADMGGETNNSPIPERCETKAVFKFLGNNINTKFSAHYNLPTTLPDSVANNQDLTLMAGLRPDSLTDVEKGIYRDFSAAKQKADTASTKKESRLKEIAWDIIYDNILNSIGAQNENLSVKLSPIFNPLYFGYSKSRGISYRIRLGARYNFSKNTSATFEPNMGYNFKIKQLYFNMPLRFNFDHKHRGWVEVQWANGNRITDSGILEKIKNENRDTVDFDALGLNYFKDNMVQLWGNIGVKSVMDITMGCIFHRRTAINKDAIIMSGSPAVYHSFTPAVTLSFHPHPKLPILTANYERGIKNVFDSSIEYEKWEFDSSYKIELNSLKRLNLRLGGGFYTNQSTNYFVDFSKFHENYLPGGWDDDWSGEFQLLNSQWYNASKYYIRANSTYESPLLLLSWLPYVGKYVETERIYASALQIEHTKPYFELGFGFSTRYFSVGLFTSMVNFKPYEFGSKFTFELFRKW